MLFCRVNNKKSLPCLKINRKKKMPLCNPLFCILTENKQLACFKMVSFSYRRSSWDWDRKPLKLVRRKMGLSAQGKYSAFLIQWGSVMTSKTSTPMWGTRILCYSCLRKKTASNSPLLNMARLISNRHSRNDIMWTLQQSAATITVFREEKVTKVTTTQHLPTVS